MRNDFCANNGIMTDDDGSYQGELALEVHHPLDPTRIYRFRSDTEPKEFFWSASKNLNYTQCPECKEELYAIEEHYHSEQHLETCNFNDKQKLREDLINANINNNEWEWVEIYYSQEAAFLSTFTFMHNKKNEMFKKYEEFTFRKEERLRRKYNP